MSLDLAEPTGPAIPAMIAPAPVSNMSKDHQGNIQQTEEGTQICKGHEIR
jgi:hypothetical protein